MSVKKLSVAELNAWVEALIPKHRVVGPQAKMDRFAYDDLKSARELRLDHDVTLIPPKKYLQPQREVIVRYDKSGRFESVMDARPLLLFGVHPYDVAAIAQMDDVFAADSQDAHYLERRRNTAIVACDVQTPSPSVFAGCMGTAVVEDGFDILLTRVDETYVADARTEAGEALLKEAPRLHEAEEALLRRRDQIWKDARRLLRKHVLNCKPEEIPVLLERSQEHPVWQRKSDLCYSCGSCNMVCPTCFCFDVQDDVKWNLNEGERSRSWDGCTLREFALVAGGHNFRKQRDARYRHRFYRKGKYLWDRMGFIACVGCGRCVTACTTNIANPVALYNALMEEER